MNQSPIFVTGFSRGGTTILMNLIASHPHVGTVGETHQLFKGSSILDSPWQVARKAVLRDLPMLLSTGQDFLSPRNLRPRPAVNERTRKFIHRVLEQSKMTSRHRHLNQFKSPNEKYTDAEIRDARLLAKNLDGAVFLTDVLLEIYPDAQFVGLVRDGLAVCEGHTRRGRSATAIGKWYSSVADKMMQDTNRISNYHLLRFEDLLADPVKELKQLYVRLGLNPFLVDSIRQQERKMIRADGQHAVHRGDEWEVHWLPIDALPDHLDTDVNRRQIERLSENDRNAFCAIAENTMQRLGYGQSKLKRDWKAA